MERHGFLGMCINNGLHKLPEDLQETYPSGILVTLWYEDHYFPSQIYWDSSVLPH